MERIRTWVLQSADRFDLVHVRRNAPGESLSEEARAEVHVFVVPGEVSATMQRAHGASSCRIDCPCVLRRRVLAGLHRVRLLVAERLLPARRSTKHMIEHS